MTSDQLTQLEMEAWGDACVAHDAWLCEQIVHAAVERAEIELLVAQHRLDPPA